MSNSCGEPIEYLEGGVLRNSTIIGAQITDSRLANSLVDGCEVKNLSGIDNASANTVIASASAQTIAQVIASDPVALQTIAYALFNIAVPPFTGDPAATQDQALPTDVMGGRDVLLGRPTLFVKLGSYGIPAY